MSTIAAISTPNAVGGISVIRISGEDAISIADIVFKSFSGAALSSMKGYTCAYGEVKKEDQKIDDVIATVFRNPKSYTGEDIVEISCHGGLYITRQILRIILENGAVLAQPGEFTKRAFLNGKMSLTQAEAVMDVISAGSKNELRHAVALKDGAMFKKISGIRQDITRILGDLAAWADYPEDDIPYVEPDKLLAELEQISCALTVLSQTYDYGKLIRDGIKTVIVGRPNVGKSTLMNCMSGYERSIVTNIPGTTRDIVEEHIKIGDLTLALSDTAGIRETDDVIEKKGVEIAIEKISQADLVLAVFDVSQVLSDDDRKIIDSVKNKNVIIILNKTDKEPLLDESYFDSVFSYIVHISAKNSEGLDELQKYLEQMFINEEIEADNSILANERQKICVDCCLKSVNEAADVLRNGESLDAVTVIIDEALENLLKLTGESVTESVVNEVFSRFCVGK
ncbi:MAG: tRNA uridine-5-carboxymethylaminomethyl(34) synthesis GTPase MnmE [Oscillospiraceae bacterium]|nr:tRNA uridine-5-carboxymethylaminomethyl(34) synthesis GTPase MnmE [Oscillospiraceae bacterium]